jgi:hypothetical protein
MRSPKYNDVFWGVCEFLMYANEKARQEFLERVEKQLSTPGRVEESNLKNADLTFAVDFSDNLYELGDGFVYIWVAEDGKIFYIGCGDSARVCNVYNRVPAFTERCDGATVYVLGSHCRKDLALTLETLCIYYAQLQGCELVNSSKKLSDYEVRYFMAKERSISVKDTPSLLRKYEQYCEYRQEYPEVVESLEKLFSSCLAKEISKTAEQVAI